MTDLVQLVSIVVSAALLVLVVELVRRRRLTEEYSFIWIVCAGALLALSLWRNLLDLSAAALGVHYPPAVLLLVLTFFVVLVSLYFSVVVSRQRQQIERLVEEVALLDADVRAMRQSTGEQENQRTGEGRNRITGERENTIPSFDDHLWSVRNKNSPRETTKETKELLPFSCLICFSVLLLNSFSLLL